MGWWPNYKMVDEFGGHREAGGSVKKAREKCKKTTPIALIIGIVLIDISIYSLVVLVFCFYYI